MVCYAIPAAAWVIHRVTGKSFKKSDARSQQLSLLLSGASLFGVIDHLWYGQLFLMSKNPLSDILLGVTITAAVFALWWAMGLSQAIPAPSTSRR